MIKAEKLKPFDSKKFRPGYMSEKYNGIHGTFNPEDGKIYSRTPNIIKGLEHIEKGLKDMFPDMYVNGEIFIPDIEFEEASGKIRSFNSTPEAEFHVFNCLFKDLDLNNKFYFKYRLNLLENRFKVFSQEKKTEAKLFLINFLHVKSLNVFFKYAKYKIDNGAEGICWIAKDHINAPGKRRWDWMKYVPYREKEVTIIGVHAGTEGKKYERSLGSLECRDKEGRIFNVGIFKGQTDEWRQRIFDSMCDYLGAVITVQYKNLTKRGVPYQPRFKCFRWDL